MNRSDPYSAGGGTGGGTGGGDANRFPHRNLPPLRGAGSADGDDGILRWEADESRHDEPSSPSAPPYAREPQPRSQSPQSQPPVPPMRILPSDVLCGRGKASYNHAGNMRFRDSIASWLPRYRDAVHLFDKALIVDAVIGDVRRSGGRFLRYDHFASRAVNELSEHQIKEKVGRALRDAVAAGEATRKAAARRRRRSSGSAETRADRGDEFGKAAPLPQPDTPLSRRAISSRSSAPRTIRRAGARESSRGGSEPSAAAVAVAVASTDSAAEASDDAHEQFVAAINSVLGPAPAEEASGLSYPGRKDSADETDPFHQLC